MKLAKENRLGFWWCCRVKPCNICLRVTYLHVSNY